MPSISVFSLLRCSFSLQFFSSLTNLLTITSQKAQGSIYLVQKPLLDNANNNGNSTETSPPPRPSILIRATDGNTHSSNPKKHETTSTKVKISTVVSPEGLDAFYSRYAEVCKLGMSGLKKKQRKRKAKAKGARKVSKG